MNHEHEFVPANNRGHEIPNLQSCYCGAVTSTVTGSVWEPPETYGVEYKVKVTTDTEFSEQQIQDWLNKAADKGWELVSDTFFGSGILWVFSRNVIPGRTEDTDDIEGNPAG